LIPGLLFRLVFKSQGAERDFHFRGQPESSSAVPTSIAFQVTYRLMSLKRPLPAAHQLDGGEEITRAVVMVWIQIKSDLVAIAQAIVLGQRR